MDISIGIMAYNEGKNIGKLLESINQQHLEDVFIREIIVVSSASTDETNNIVLWYAKTNSKIRLLTEKKRKGKASAINRFLKAAKSDVLVMISADTCPGKDSVEKICAPLKDKKTGIVAARPVPLNPEKGIINRIVRLQWRLHHLLSCKNPKYGEMIAFRRLFSKIDNTAVDEEHIAMLVKSKAMLGAYEPRAVVYNKGPDNLIGFLRQRRRIYCGHLKLKRKNNYSCASFRAKEVIKAALKDLNKKNFMIYFIAAFFEVSGRAIGFFDYYLGKKHYVWKVAKSTKF